MPKNPVSEIFVVTMEENGYDYLPVTYHSKEVYITKAFRFEDDAQAYCSKHNQDRYSGYTYYVRHAQISGKLAYVKEIFALILETVNDSYVSDTFITEEEAEACKMDSVNKAERGVSYSIKKLEFVS